MVSVISFLIFLCFINFHNLLSLLHAFNLTSSHAPFCHDHERSALFLFKNTFLIDCRASSDDPFAYPKVESWNLKTYNCCSWDGVSCHHQTGHVIGIDLSSSCLYGSINSTSTLFHLLHLRTLNLAYNHFNYSRIPSEMGLLSKLSSLNLSFSSFAGQIPSTISQLSYLSILDLTSNTDLKLRNPDFGSLIRNLTKLEDLRLSRVGISSTVPSILANLSSMRSLRLSGCGLYGEFPIEIFHLPNLEILKVAENPYLKGHLPEFNSTSPLNTLVLYSSIFSGKLPKSIGNLVSLNMLDISGCGFFGHLPASLGNVIEMEILVLGNNNFEVTNSSSLSWIGKLSKLRYLTLSKITFNKESPFLANLTQLTILSLDFCQISSQIPSWLTNMTQLEQLDLRSNQLQGLIPDSIFQLTNLTYLSLANNNLSGTVELATFLSKFKKLKELYLSGNDLSLHDNVDSNVTIGKFNGLGFASCNLSHFPRSLRHQGELQWLDLSYNNIHDHIPQWLWNSTVALTNVDLSGNYLTGFEGDPNVLPWTQIIYLDFTKNMLRGTLPMPPSSIEIYLVPDNRLSGEISPIVCNMNALQVLDLSYNNFTGMLPQCLGDLSTSIRFLHLGSNHFHGKYPDNHVEGCNIRMLNVDSNELEGAVPKSLANCSKLEALIFGSNNIYDVFPSWLGSLKELKILILRSNQLQSALENRNSDVDFPKLRIIDISHNNFSGKLPARYFLNWNAMKVAQADWLEYMEIFVPLTNYLGLGLLSNTPFSMTLTNKGRKLEYDKIIKSLIAIDFSSNNFEGDIPKVIGNLSGLRLLNLSNNNLNGGIPTSLGNLTKLESLDLSRNNLIGEIPEELTQLGFLSAFNVSYNQLTGPIPHGKQFNTFENSSYQNNLGLCGNPMSKKCEETFPPSNVEEDQDSWLVFEFGWKPVVMGYGSGLVIGSIIAHIVVTRKREWFAKSFRIRNGRMARDTRHRN